MSLHFIHIRSIQLRFFHLFEILLQTADESAWMSLTGNDGHIWFDKSMTYVVYDNGVAGAGNIDHTLVDAMVCNLLSLKIPQDTVPLA